MKRTIRNLSLILSLALVNRQVVTEYTIGAAE